jgi:hypothetical protein
MTTTIWLLAVFVAGVAASACPRERQHPVVIVPGICGSVLDGLLANVAGDLPHSSCKRSIPDWEVFWIKLSKCTPSQFVSRITGSALCFRN